MRNIMVDQRHDDRCPVRIPMVYWGEEFLGQGTVVDLSPRGLFVVGNDPVESGTEIRGLLFLPSDTEPLYIYRALVRWTRGIEFGVEILTIAASERARLEAVIAEAVLQREVPWAVGEPWKDNGPVGL